MSRLTTPRMHIIKAQSQSLQMRTNIQIPLAPMDESPSFDNTELDDILVQEMIHKTHHGCRLHSVMNYKTVWHKFIITGGCKYYKDFILKLIIESVAPCVLIPVQYEKETTDTHFMARDCSPAIEKISREGFVIPNPHGEDVRLRIVLAAYRDVNQRKVDIYATINAVITKRYNAEDKSLNLKDFHNDPDLTNILFCPLSASKIFSFVTSIIRNNQAEKGQHSNNRNTQLRAPLASLSLANNDLSSITALEPLCGLRPHLRVLNLSYNKLDLIDDLSVLAPIGLVEINLDNNPLCQQFDHEAAYIKKVRELLPTIKILDGVTLVDPGFPQPRRNYLVCPEAGPLADQFLQHYFDLYDEPSRSKLKSVYHEQALFSMTAVYVPGQTTSATAQLSKYALESRNLLRMSDLSHAHRLLCCGRDEVGVLLARLPPTTHDPYSFTVDCSAYSETAAHLTVTGEFREVTPSGSPAVRSFNRSFSLACSAAGDEWQIANESLHVWNACSEAAAQAFATPRPAQRQRPPVMSSADKQQMVQIVAQITDMNPGYAVKCLEDSKWDIAEALTVFRDLFKLGRIPREAFDVGY